MSDTHDADPTEPGSRPASGTGPLRIVGATEAGAGRPDTSRARGSGGESPATRPSRRAVFESVPDAPSDFSFDAMSDSPPWGAKRDGSAAGTVRAGDEDDAWQPETHGEEPWQDEPTVIDTDPPRRHGLSAIPDAPVPGDGDDTSLPHWTEPPTGQLPKVLGSRSDREESWSAYTSSPRWRGDATSGWDDDLDPGVDDLADQTPAVPAQRPTLDDFFSFDEGDPDDIDVPPPPRQPRSRRAPRAADQHGREARRPSAARAPSSTGRNIPVASALGIGLAALAIALFRIGPGATMGFVLVLLGIGAAEFFDASRRGGYRPATLLGLAASVGLPIAVYWRGAVAYPIVGGLTIMAALLWFLFALDQEQVTADLGVTFVGVAYVGGFGSVAALILRTPGVDTTRILLGAVVPVVVNDIFAYTVGRNAGRTPLMPHISPNKTVEGLVGGALGSIIASVVFNDLMGANPWDGLGSAFALGLLIALLAPLGDLAESMIKRDLGIKDMGSILPGHGGVLDRFDAVLFVLPAVYYLALLRDVLPG